MKINVPWIKRNEIEICKAVGIGDPCRVKKCYPVVDSEEKDRMKKGATEEERIGF